MAQDDNRFYAYEVHPYGDMPLTVAPLQRAWMDAAEFRAPYRCLPMNMANQAGWVLHNPVDFTAVWNGGPTRIDVQLDFDGGPSGQDPSAAAMPNVITVAPYGQASRPADARIGTHFGSGIITFALPYLFRTPAGVNLWVKGLSNWIKDGAQALEGIVETDWLAATFTMNWKLTRPDYPVRFERGEPICMVVPVARHLAESLDPVCLPLQAHPELEQHYLEWSRARDEFNRALHAGHPEAHRLGWQKDYMAGTHLDGTPAPDHQNRIDLKEFQRLE
jgi:hypothetical protein